MCMYVCMCVYLCVCLCVGRCMCVCMFVCMYVCMYVCLYEFVYMCVCIMYIYMCVYVVSKHVIMCLCMYHMYVLNLTLSLGRLSYWASGKVDTIILTCRGRTFGSQLSCRAPHEGSNWSRESSRMTRGLFSDASSRDSWNTSVSSLIS